MDKTNLLQKLRLCRPALGGNIIKGLDSYLFEPDRVSAFNGSLCMTTTLDEPFPVTGAVEGQSFFKLLNELDKEVELSAIDASTLLVKSGRSRTKFPVEVVDTSYLQDLEEVSTLTDLPTQVMFAAGLRRCMTSLTGKSISVENAGVHVFMEENECRMYSTNGTTFSRFIFPLDGIVTPASVFIPATFVEVLLAVYAELGTEPEAIQISDKYIRAKFGNLLIRNSFYANPVNGELRGLVDSGIESVSIVDLPKSLCEAFKLAETITSDSTVNLSWDGEQSKMFISATGKKSQELVEELEIPYPGTGELKFDLKGLRKIMETCNEVGLGEDYILLVGAEKCFDYVIMSKQ